MALSRRRRRRLGLRRGGEHVAALALAALVAAMAAGQPAGPIDDHDFNPAVILSERMGAQIFDTQQQGEGTVVGQVRRQAPR